VAPRARAELALVGVTLLWGLSFNVVQSALADAPVWTFLALRFTLSTLVLGVACRFRGPAVGLLPGLFLAAAYFFQTSGLLYTTPAKSAFLTAACTVLVPLGAMLVYRNRPGPHEALGVLMAMLGMGLMAFPRGAPAVESLNRGDLLTAACAAAFAGHILAVGHWARRVDPAGFILVQTGAVAALAWGACGVYGLGAIKWSGRLAAAVVFTALACTVAAYWVQAWAQRRTSATRTALIFSLEPVAAAATSWAVSGEVLAPRALWGALLILAGVVAAEMKPSPSGGHQDP
jgi:drug/metabolite transporter (DMT)-like permease